MKITIRESKLWSWICGTFYGHRWQSFHYKSTILEDEKMRLVEETFSCRVCGEEKHERCKFPHPLPTDPGLQI